jgi:hypothetical protein
MSCAYACAAHWLRSAAPACGGRHSVAHRYAADCTARSHCTLRYPTVPYGTLRYPTVLAALMGPRDPGVAPGQTRGWPEGSQCACGHGAPSVEARRSGATQRSAARSAGGRSGGECASASAIAEVAAAGAGATGAKARAFGLALAARAVCARAAGSARRRLWLSAAVAHGRHAV